MGSSAYLTSFFFPLPPPARFFFKYAGVPIVLGENVHSSASSFNLATFSSSYSRRDLDRTDPALSPRVFCWKVAALAGNFGSTAGLVSSELLPRILGTAAVGTGSGADGFFACTGLRCVLAAVFASAPPDNLRAGRGWEGSRERSASKSSTSLSSRLRLSLSSAGASAGATGAEVATGTVACFCISAVALELPGRGELWFTPSEVSGLFADSSRRRPGVPRNLRMSAFSSKPRSGSSSESESTASTTGAFVVSTGSGFRCFTGDGADIFSEKSFTAGDSALGSSTTFGCCCCGDGGVYSPSFAFVAALSLASDARAASIDVAGLGFGLVDSRVTLAAVGDFLDGGADLTLGDAGAGLLASGVGGMDGIHALGTISSLGAGTGLGAAA